MKKSLVGAFIATSATFLGLASPVSFAQTGMPQPPAAQQPASPAPDFNDARDQHTALKWYLQRTFDAVDTNHDGVIDRKEWAAFQEKNLARRRAAFERHFKADDKNGDGTLSRAEVQASEPWLAPHFDQADLNHDGQLSQEEVRAYIRRLRHAAYALDNPPSRP